MSSRSAARPTRGGAGRSRRGSLTAAACGLLFAGAAPAAPPPPPPAYVAAAAERLAEASPRRPEMEAGLFADDVIVLENGATLAQGKAAWRTWRAADAMHPGRVVGYSQAWDPGGAGNLLVLDTFDTVDRRNLPPTFLADPRMATRATLYQFGPDGLIHAVRIERADGFVQVPRAGGR